VTEEGSKYSAQEYQLQQSFVIDLFEKLIMFNELARIGKEAILKLQTQFYPIHTLSQQIFEYQFHILYACKITTATG